MNNQNAFGVKVPSLVMEYVPRIPSGKVLDMGCGAGATSHFLASKGFEVHAIDRFEYPDFRAHERIRFFKCDAGSFEVEEAGYSAIVAWNILQFFPASVRKQLIVAMARGLSPGGLLFVQSFTDSDQFLEIVRAESWHEAEPLAYQARDGRWLSFFRQNELRTILEKEALLIEVYAEYLEHSTNAKGDPHRFGCCDVVARKSV